MVFRERSYGVLVVSASGKFNSAMRELLPMTDFWPVDYAASVSEARGRLLDTEYDLVLINAPLPDDFGARLATGLCADTARACCSSSRPRSMKRSAPRCWSRAS